MVWLTAPPPAINNILFEHFPQNFLRNEITLYYFKLKTNTRKGWHCIDNNKGLANWFSLKAIVVVFYGQLYLFIENLSITYILWMYLKVV